MLPASTTLKRRLALCFILLGIFLEVNGQRSILHWRKDLEYRLNAYRNQRQTIENILASSINAPIRQFINGPARVSSGGNVRFTDLIIPAGSLILDDQVARPTVKIMINKTQTYVASKMNELYQIKSQLDVIKRKVRNSSRTFIYKGTFGSQNQPPTNAVRMGGIQVFKQFIHGRTIRSTTTQVRYINFTDVDKVIDEAYLDNQLTFDSKQRIFYEGRKTFWRSVFTKHLNSGCCDRLKPIHTSRVMTRLGDQEILAPVLFNGQSLQQKVVLDNLHTKLGLHNRLITLSTVRPGPNLPEVNELIPSVPDNFINLNNLISIRQLDHIEILKTIVFKDFVLVDNAYVRPPTIDNKVIIDFDSSPGLLFDLSHENYLLKYLTTKNYTPAQHISGPVVVNGDVHIVAGINATDVNQVPLFERFVAEKIVRIDRPTVIRSPIRFNALPRLLNPSSPSRAPQNVPILHISGGLKVNLINGMRIPYDIVPSPSILSPNVTIKVQGTRQFVNLVTILAPVNVKRTINGLQLPDEVIPLHTPDNPHQVSLSNLLFTDGIVANHVIVRENRFDDIALQEVHGDAQNLIMQSIHAVQPDGTLLVKAPLRVTHLTLLENSPQQGLLNGFRPQDLIELTNFSRDTVVGKKTFLATVEADECLFKEINSLPDWANHLIRVDRPNTVQTVHTKLLFANPTTINPINQDALSSIRVKDFVISFYPNNNYINYQSNMDFSPEFYNIYLALERSVASHTERRYRILGQVQIIDPSGGAGRVNNIDLADIVTLDSPFNFADRFVMVGKVDVKGILSAGRILSNYPLDVMDLVEFDKYRIPISDLRAPIRLSNLVLASTNRASYIQCHMLNGITFNQFVSSIMSLTRPQVVDNHLSFTGPVNLDGIVRTESSLNTINEFSRFANGLQNARYSFEDGLQCSSVVIKT